MYKKQSVNNRSTLASFSLFSVFVLSAWMLAVALLAFSIFSSTFHLSIKQRWNCIKLKNTTYSKRVTLFYHEQQQTLKLFTMWVRCFAVWSAFKFPSNNNHCIVYQKNRQETPIHWLNGMSYTLMCTLMLFITFKGIFLLSVFTWQDKTHAKKIHWMCIAIF